MSAWELTPLPLYVRLSIKCEERRENIAFHARFLSLQDKLILKLLAK